MERRNTTGISYQTKSVTKNRFYWKVKSSLNSRQRYPTK